MADRIGLNVIGYVFGGLTAAVILVAALVVHKATAHESQDAARIEIVR